MASAKITAVGNDEKSFLNHLNSKGLQIGDSITVEKKELFDDSMIIVMKSKKETMLSHQVAERIWVVNIRRRATKLLFSKRKCIRLEIEYLATTDQIYFLLPVRLC